MALELLIEETKGLSEDALMRVIRFVRFIKKEEQRAKATEDPLFQPITEEQ